MKCISLWQPWATLIAIEAKQFETRSWSTDVRGRIAIHAAKRPVTRADITPQIGKTLYAANYGTLLSLPLGVVVCTVELTDCLSVGEAMAKGLISDQERFFGDYSLGRYCWRLENVELVNNAPAVGRQGFWNWIPLEANR